MKYKMLLGGVPASFVIVLEKGEKIIESLQKFVRVNSIRGGYFNGIGAISSVELGYYNFIEKRYETRKIDGMFELVSLTGNSSYFGDDVVIHAHLVVADSSMRTFGGHLKEAVVSATCEIMFVAFSEKIERKFNEDIGLNLIKLN